MRKIVYYVATSLDGYISGKDDDISMFAPEGEMVDQYLYDLESFDTVIMGKRTYEFGYQFGLKPGQPAYSHMDHYIFSNSLKLENASEQVNVVSIEIEKVQMLKEEVGSDIYLCGGGMFAGWLMEHGMIDELKLKVNPIILGGGIRLFGDYEGSTQLKVIYSRPYTGGYQITTYKVINN
ncbi:dihydrofolate reductase family protein [Ekhidna sp. MALMAid0563]|uniref:dihydrofolate reductase family protein n=1 Tax=Ekhidna sp. MALMAid0563 TaxID=3143937 RepID=UPI0032DF5EFD